MLPSASSLHLSDQLSLALNGSNTNSSSNGTSNLSSNMTTAGETTSLTPEAKIENGNYSAFNPVLFTKTQSQVCVVKMLEKKGDLMLRLFLSVCGLLDGKFCHTSEEFSWKSRSRRLKSLQAIFNNSLISLLRAQRWATE